MRAATSSCAATPAWKAAVVRLAGQIDGYLGLLTYLARPEADIVHADRAGVRPVKPRRPKRDQDIWLVGYSDSNSA